MNYGPEMELETDNKNYKTSRKWSPPPLGPPPTMLTIAIFLLTRRNLPSDDLSLEITLKSRKGVWGGEGGGGG